ncbi:hypothetical protein [Sulfuricurvum sp.]|uniref:hypothetical protein n=1 Tax=Sulfuricurvum sp. TaxID=2025608 RepID=UPI002602425E|nr:hypothetical protein [Sulfuricurvum sp.]MDD4949646.1 hypothetical protein [Sulfuricurvum sp.]
MKSMIKNKLGDTTLTSYLPMTGANAVTLMEAVSEGTYEVFESDGGQVGTDAGVTLCYDVKVQLRDSATGKKDYLNILAKSSVSPEEIQTALTGITINMIKVDEVVVLLYSPITFS